MENPLSKGILSGEYQPGDHIEVDGGSTGLVLSKVKDLARVV